MSKASASATASSSSSRHRKVTFNKPLQPPASIEELIKHGSLEEESLAKSTSMMMLSSSPIIIAAKPVDGPGN